MDILFYPAGRKARLADPPAKKARPALITNRPEGRPLAKGSPAGRRGSSQTGGARWPTHSRAPPAPRNPRLLHPQAQELALVGGAGLRGRAGVPHGVPARRQGGGAAPDRLTRTGSAPGECLRRGRLRPCATPPAGTGARGRRQWRRPAPRRAPGHPRPTPPSAPRGAATPGAPRSRRGSATPAGRSRVPADGLRCRAGHVFKFPLPIAVSV
jgi:hypothetical protein